MKEDREQIQVDRKRVLSRREATHLYFTGKIEREEYQAAIDREEQTFKAASDYLYEVSRRHQKQQREPYQRVMRRSFWDGVRSLFRFW